MNNPAALIDSFLQLCEDRDLEAASQYLSPDAHLQFPGGKSFGSLTEMVAAPKSYTWVRKHRDRYLVGTEGDSTTITSIGRLYGEWLDGTEFHEIRYVDVFVIRDGLIVEQLVWNDLSQPAESRASAQTGQSTALPTPS